MDGQAGHPQGEEGGFEAGLTALRSDIESRLKSPAKRPGFNCAPGCDDNSMSENDNSHVRLHLPRRQEWPVVDEGQACRDYTRTNTELASLAGRENHVAATAGGLVPNMFQLWKIDFPNCRSF